MANQENEEQLYDRLSNEVIRGIWNNGQERRKRLTEAGYDYKRVQELVNKKVVRQSVPDNENEEQLYDRLSNEVIRGIWSNGQERCKRLTEAGYDYKRVQELVNKKVKL